MANDVRGRFVWYELLTSDPQGAKAFYTEVIGWKTEDWTGGAMPYTMWKRGASMDTMVGGLLKLPDEAKKMGAPPHWLAYIGTPNVDTTVEDAKKRGATVLVPPMSMPKIGRWSVLRDPQGAVFAAFTPEGESKPEKDAQTGDFSWNELVTTDPAKAWEFYSGLFGWKQTGEFDMGPQMGKYQMYGLGERTYGGIMNKPKEMPAPPHWMLYVQVDDVNRVVENVKKPRTKPHQHSASSRTRDARSDWRYLSFSAAGK